MTVMTAPADNLPCPAHTPRVASSEALAAHDAATVARREALFAESLADRAVRVALGMAYALRSKRIGGLPALYGVMLRDALKGGSELPDVAAALAKPDGLCGLVRSHEPAHVIAAYRRGLYPWCHIGPMKWWAPAERMALSFDNQHLSKNNRRMMRNNHYRVTFDAAFEDVLVACAEKRPGRPTLTWITPDMMRLVANLYDIGVAHSFEVWNREGELVGGGYGFAIGPIFYTESLFSREPSVSKIGLAVVNYHLNRWGFALNDGKTWSENLASQGFALMPRADFNAIAAQGDVVAPGRWQMDADAAEVAQWQPKKAAPAPALVPEA